MITVPTAPEVHVVFDGIAWVSGLGLSALLYRWRLRSAVAQVAARTGPGYFASLACGAALGAWAAGSLNTLRDAVPVLSHSIAGALAGAIVAVEAYKAVRGVRGSTGGIYVGSFSLGVVIGRWGCLFAGLPDRTYGIATGLPWGADLGDGIPRHPVQVSGGEPTIHPQFFDILRAAKRRPVRHLMINTNGVRIAREPGFAEKLTEFMPRFEVYLQFDSLQRDALMDLRGADLTGVRLDALAALERNGISTTLVVTLKRGVNDREIADIVRFALQWRCVRGVTFQPIQDAGRNAGFDPKAHRMVLTEIRRRIAEAGVFALEDLISLPCNPDQICIGYGLRNGTHVAPVTSLLPRELFVAAVPNTVSFEAYPELRREVFNLLSLSTAQADTSEKLASLLCCLPAASVPQSLAYEDTFRVVVSQFLDRFNFDLGTVKRSCVHIVQTDGRIIPFDTYNTFYRPGASGAAALRRGQATL